MKNKWIVIIISTIILLSCVFYVVILAPYNLQDKGFEDSLGITNINSIKEIDELAQYFKEDKIKKVKYIGNDTYKVWTNKGEFIIVADYTGYDYWKYRIFKYDKSVKHFTNPM